MKKPYTVEYTNENPVNAEFAGGCWNFASIMIIIALVAFFY